MPLLEEARLASKEAIIQVSLASPAAAAKPIRWAVLKFAR
jgi:hypothetical protein